MGNRIHDKWIPISSHTAKCDKCLQNNKSVCQRCQLCNRQLCRRCIRTTDGDNIHFVKEEDLDWRPPPPPKRYPRASPSLDLDRLNTTGRRTVWGPSARALRYTPGGDQGQDIVRKESFLDREESFLEREESILESEEQTTDPDETEDDELYMPSPKRSKKGSSVPKKRQSSGVKKAPSRSKTTQSASAKRESFLTKSVQSGAVDTESFLNPVPRQTRQQLPPSVITQLEEERKAAWESSPILAALCNNGQCEEAEDMVDVAQQLLELSRGGG
jgi:hypothetical protein